MPAPIDSASWTGRTPRRRPFVSAFTVTVNLPTDEAAMSSPHVVRTPRIIKLQGPNDAEMYRAAEKSLNEPVILLGAKWLLTHYGFGGPSGFSGELMEVFEVAPPKWEPQRGDPTPRPHAGGPNTGACVGPARGAREALRAAAFEAMRGGGHQPAGAPSSDGLKPPSGGSSGRLPGVGSWQDEAKRLRAAIEAWVMARFPDNHPSPYDIEGRVAEQRALDEAENKLVALHCEPRPVADRPKSGKPPEPLVADFLTEQTMWEGRFGCGSPKPGHLDAWAAENPPTTREQARAQATEPQPDPQYLTASEGLGLLGIMSAMARAIDEVGQNSATDGTINGIALSRDAITSLRAHIERRIGVLGVVDPVERARVLSGIHTAIEPLTREQVADLPHLARVIVEWPNIEGRRVYTVHRDHAACLLALPEYYGPRLVLYDPGMSNPYTPHVWRVEDPWGEGRIA